MTWITFLLRYDPMFHKLILIQVTHYITKKDYKLMKINNFNTKRIANGKSVVIVDPKCDLAFFKTVCLTAAQNPHAQFESPIIIPLPNSPWMVGRTMSPKSIQKDQKSNQLTEDE